MSDIWRLMIIWALFLWLIIHTACLVAYVISIPHLLLSLVIITYNLQNPGALLCIWNCNLIHDLSRISSCHRVLGLSRIPWSPWSWISFAFKNNGSLLIIAKFTSLLELHHIRNYIKTAAFFKKCHSINKVENYCPRVTWNGAWSLSARPTSDDDWKSKPKYGFSASLGEFEMS